MGWLFNLPGFVLRFVSSAINRVDQLLKRQKRRKEIEENDTHDAKIDQHVEDGDIDELNKALGWFKPKK